MENLTLENLTVTNDKGERIITTYPEFQHIRENGKSTQDIPHSTMIDIGKLVPYKDHPFKLYEGERLRQFSASLEEVGLQSPIVVRPIENDKFEILSGHNRYNAARSLGWTLIPAIIKTNLSDEEAERIVLDSNMNQQSFAEWTFSVQTKVIKMFSKYIKEHSQQGKRNDLNEDVTYVSDEHKLPDKTKRQKSRDKISQQLGISTSRFERFRSIIKLDDDILVSLCKAVDESRMSFMGAYRISQLKPGETAIVADILNNNATLKLKATHIKVLFDTSKAEDVELTQQGVSKLLLSDDAGE
jgi:ParB family chromosome partitioning protein